jgi:hypothetical protein
MTADLPSSAIPAAAYTALGAAIQAYEPEAAALLARSPAALLQVLLEAGRRAAIAAVPAIQAAGRERVCAELGNDHYVTFTEDRWTVEHSVECRLSGQMHECAYHAAVALVADLPLPNMTGRWRIAGIDASGLPILTSADPEAQP